MPFELKALIWSVTRQGHLAAHSQAMALKTFKGGLSTKELGENQKNALTQYCANTTSIYFLLNLQTKLFFHRNFSKETRAISLRLSTAFNRSDHKVKGILWPREISLGFKSFLRASASQPFSGRHLSKRVSSNKLPMYLGPLQLLQPVKQLLQVLNRFYIRRFGPHI